VATPRSEEYLEAIYKLQEETEKAVSISKVAEYLQLSAASASEMIKRLKQGGSVKYSAGREISLTKKGLREASQVIRRHRLAERLLTDFLHLRWDEIHEEACKLEHVISPEVEERLVESLGNPTTCPHGYPIPNKSGEYPKIRIMPLADVKSGSKAIIARVREDDPEILRYLAKLGLIPEAVVEILEIAPFDGPLTLKVDNDKFAIGRDLAKKIMVKK